MKKITFILTMVIISFSLNKALAQNGRNNNSDFKVPLPVVAPPIFPDFGFNISVPVMPPVSVPSGITLNIVAANFMPQIPSLPLMPAAPLANANQIIQGETANTSLPKTIKLPPLAPISSNPQVRLALY